MDGFNLGEDNKIKSITIKDGKLRFEVGLGREFVHAFAKSNNSLSFSTFAAYLPSD